MRVVRQSPTELVVKDSSVWLTALFAGFAVVMTAAVGFSQPIKLLAPAVFLLFGTITARSSTFSFDGMQRTVRWSGFRPFKAESGAILFDEIDDVVVEVSSGGNGAIAYRLALKTRQGLVPMAYAYSGSRDGYAALRRQILAFVKPGLQHEPPASHVEGIPVDLASSIASLLQQGRSIDAVALLRTREKISLAEAKKRVDAVNTKGRSGNTAGSTIGES
jgi:hypothetical protein